MKHSTIIDQLRWRAAVKTYDPNKKLGKKQVDVLLKAVNLAPSSYGLQPYKFLLIEDPEVRQRIRLVGYDQPAMTDASHLLVMAAKIETTAADIDAYIKNISKVREVELKDLASYGEMMKGSITSKSKQDNKEWAARQVYIPLGVLMATAAIEKIDATPMEGFDALKVDKVLDLTTQGYASVAMVALGYRSTDDQYGKMPKVRQPLSQIVSRV
jgi:nitroreductase / dihydropteridine reductase